MIRGPGGGPYPTVNVNPRRRNGFQRLEFPLEPVLLLKRITGQKYSGMVLGVSYFGFGELINDDTKH